MEKAGFVYIMASGRNGTIYIGVTSDHPRRIWEHCNSVIGGFTRKYHCHLLVWYEAHDSIDMARQRELQMKEWKRAWRYGRSQASIPIGRTCTIVSHCHDCLPDRTPAFAGEHPFPKSRRRL